MKVPVAAGLIALLSTAYAQTSKKCTSGICYELNIPASTASSGKGDIFFQLSAPTSNRWVALGQGSQMAGAQIFVMYTSSDGKNVTVSPRLGVGHVMPKFNSDARVTLLDGSGVDGDTMTANVRCESCNTWSGGSSDFTSDSSASDWIFAWKKGDALDSDDTSATIAQHDKMGQISFEYSAAKGGSSTNPLLATTTSSGASASDSSSSDSDSSDGVSSDSTDAPSSYLIAHGVLGSLVFVIFLPLGAIAVRVLSVRNLVWLHAGIQLFAYVILIAAVGLGIWIARKQGELGEYHPVIGLVLFCLVSLQPLLGTLHHHAFGKYQRRTLLSHVHIWLGRIVITLGMIQGGLGLLLSDNASTGDYVAYGVVAGVIWLGYVAAAVFGEVRKGKTTRGTVSPPQKYEQAGTPPSNGAGNGHVA